jgi:type I site-specific restriction-modification system R (restriction) subunit
MVEIEPATKIDSTNIGVNQIRMYEQKTPNTFRFTQLAIIYGDKQVFIPTYPNWDKKTRFTQMQNWKKKDKKRQNHI